MLTVSITICPVLEPHELRFTLNIIFYQLSTFQCYEPVNVSRQNPVSATTSNQNQLIGYLQATAVYFENNVCPEYARLVQYQLMQHLVTFGGTGYMRPFHSNKHCRRNFYERIAIELIRKFSFVETMPLYNAKYGTAPA